MLDDASVAGRGTSGLHAGVSRGAPRRDGSPRPATQWERLSRTHRRARGGVEPRPPPRRQGTRARSLHRQFTESSAASRPSSRTFARRFPSPGRRACGDGGALGPRRATVGHRDLARGAGWTAVRTHLARPPSARERSAAELGARLEALDQQVAGLASELARAKTLWPVALRSLEARLDDAVPERTRRADHHTGHSRRAPSETADTTTISSRICARAFTRWRASRRRWSALRRRDRSRSPSPSRRRKPSRAVRASSHSARAIRRATAMLRPLDVILLLCGRRGAWARGWMAYRALAVLAVQHAHRRSALAAQASSTKYAIRMASTSSSPRS